MERKFEVLSPAGSKSGFFTAIKAGADAVYMGLNKFNARMRADNIVLEDLSGLVRYAHLKGVSVYITLNTLVSDSEMLEVVDMVGKCIDVKVDAFIVQDYGIIGLLRKVYPNICLHGSTQLGVHNRRGAEVAKKLGLSRVVLSREVTLNDIRDIKENVDIELEVFVQGAMCVAFSGNCYLSSLKHNASGNRGECKQLCRLPFTLSSGDKSTSGYTISPRDNCMLDYIPALCDLGVQSYKIEGRLRHEGYVATTTNVYRDAIDAYLNKFDFDNNGAKDILKRVFARGEFISGYFGGNDIIDKSSNKHIGVKIGRVESCGKFKDIYKYTLILSRDIVSGDGLRILGNGCDVSLGVGNVECNGNKYIVYGKNPINAKSDVYITLDSRLEGGFANKSRKRQIKMSVILRENENIKLSIEYGNISALVEGAVCQSARSSALTEDNIIKQLSKVDSDIFEIVDIDVTMDNNLFLPVSAINEIRRVGIESISNKILVSDFVSESCVIDDCDSDGICAIMKAKADDIECKHSSIAIVDESMNINSLKGKHDALIFSPTIYSVDVIEKFIKKYNSNFESLPYLNLPVIALKSDLVLLDKIVNKFAGKVRLVANNIYALGYVESCEVLAGAGMNIANRYSISTLLGLGVSEFVSSIEKWCPTIKNTYKINHTNHTLMTFAHCPNKTLGGDCGICNHKNHLSLSGNVGDFKIRRFKLSNCYFELVDGMKSIGKNSDYQIIDLRD